MEGRPAAPGAVRYLAMEQEKRRSPVRRLHGPRDMTSQLPPDLLEMVVARLTDVRARNAASLVCGRWREAERATRRHLELRGCLKDLPSLCHGPTDHQPFRLPMQSPAPGEVPTDVGLAQGPASVQTGQHVNGAPDSGGARGTPLSLGSGVEALDLSLIWPWGESLLLAAPTAGGASAGTRATPSHLRAPAAAPPAPRTFSHGLTTASQGQGASPMRSAAKLSETATKAGDAKLGPQALAVPVARLDTSGAREEGASQTEQIVPQLANTTAYPAEMSPSASGGTRQPTELSAAAAQGAPGSTMPPLARIPGPHGHGDASAPPARIPGQLDLRDSSDDLKQVQSVLRTAFPHVSALRVYLQAEKDVSAVAGTWEPHQIQHLAPVRLALCLEGPRLLRGRREATVGVAMQGTGSEAAPPARQGERAGELSDTSGLRQLLAAYPSLTALDLSQFLCMPEDITRALSMASSCAQGLRVLNLLKIGARGLAGSELRAVAGACPQLRSLRCTAEFDARLADPVDDAALAHLAGGCPRLRHLHLVHSSLVPQPLLEHRAFRARSPQGLETAEWGSDAAIPGFPDVPWAGTDIPIDWPRISALGPECVAEVDACAAAADGGTSDPEGSPTTPVAVSISGLRAALALLPSLVHLGLLLPGPPPASLSSAEDGTLPAAAQGGEGGGGGQGGGGGRGARAGAAGGGAGITGTDSTSTSAGPATDWCLLDLSSLCPALTSLHLCPLGAPLPATAPQTGASLSPSNLPALSPLLSPSLLQLHLRAATVSVKEDVHPPVSAEQSGEEDSAFHLSPMSQPPRSDLCLEIASACPRLRSLELWGCHGLHREPLRAALQALAMSLRHLSILHCQPLSTADLLCALEPLRPSLLSLEVSLCSGVAPTEPCAPTGLAPGTLLPAGPASASTQWIGASPAEGAGLWRGGLPGTSGRGRAQLQRLSLWVPLGMSLGGLTPRLLGPACPLLHAVSISVGGDCRGLPGPGGGDFGLASLAAYPGLTTVFLNLSGVSGYSLSCPEGSSDIDTWERFHMAGIEAQGGCAAVHLWPPRDCDTQRHALSLAAASLLALCPALRRLTVHGMASEHALAQLLRAPGLRDVKLIPDCHFWGPGTGAMAHIPLSKVRRASLCRFHTTLTAKGCPD